MGDDTRVNLAASLHNTAGDLSEVAVSLAGLSTDDEIERHAKILDRIAEDANDGASIRRLITHYEPVSSPLARRVPSHAGDAHRIPPDTG